MNVQTPHSADAATVEEALAAGNYDPVIDSKSATDVALQNTLLTPRFYTTDFDEMDAIDVTPVRAEWDKLIGQMQADPNRGHFKKNEDWDHIDWDGMEPRLKAEFIDFLISSCTAEFSGCVLYKEMKRRGSNKDITTLFRSAREFCRAARDQKVDEFGLQLGLHPVPVDMVPVLVLLEVALVGVRLHLADQLVPFGPHRCDVDGIHLVKIGGVEARGQQRVLHRHIGRGLAVDDGVIVSGGQRVFDSCGIGGMCRALHVHDITSSLKENSQSSMNSRSPVARVQSCSSLEARVMTAVRCSSITSPKAAMISGPCT